ncbi:universal stress protein [uncultured Zobellia sp.]|uniref:universal stress protein n=1 Tax=uncultured Zobellia sp. TaxID=255433 RepID=UPI002598E918|nr:universal stress protein [uncultured Zobellia sp.]
MLKVLLPTDFSENSRNAIDYAMRLYEHTECVFYFLHTYTPAAYRIDYILGSPAQVGLGDNWQLEAESQMHDFCTNIAEENQNPRHTFIEHIALESLLTEILKVSAKEKIDRIVMGTQGATGAKSVFLSTRTVNVIKIAACPVLVIPNGCFYKEPKKIALATHFKRNFSADVLEPIKEVLNKYEASMHVMHINEEERLDSIQISNRNTLEAYLSKYKLSYHWMPNFTNKTKSIQVFLKELDIDILAMIKHDHDFLEGLMREPVIKKVSFCVEIPCLVVPVAN